MPKQNSNTTLYEYYTCGGICEGLSAKQPCLLLNKKNIYLYSGSIHYFRVPKEYWRDRLKKLRAAGLNTVETYIAWNLHEPQKGCFDFGDGGSEMTDFLDIKEFFQIAKEEDLLAIVRPGPYICAEWEFGGLPSWLLRDKNMMVRTSQTNFMKHVTSYFNKLLPILAELQFTKGGPIVAFQVENEYGSTARPGKFVPDKQYLKELRCLMLKNGIVELLLTSDSPFAGTVGTLPDDFWLTANFGDDPEPNFNQLKEIQKNKPVMVMEFWCGWFDHWSENHNTVCPAGIGKKLAQILKYPASINFYMFHGGTTFGFMNGGNYQGGTTDNSSYKPDTSSYDYDAPISESGDYTTKYNVIKRILEKFNTIPVKVPNPPCPKPRVEYPAIKECSQLTITDIISKIEFVYKSKDLISMEDLPVTCSGQSYGYIIYRKTNLKIAKEAVLKISGNVCDTLMVLINGKLISKPLENGTDLDGFGFWRLKDGELVLSDEEVFDATLDLIVENFGRVNFGAIEQFKQYKGLHQGGVFINDCEVFDWEIMALDFKKSWNNKLSGWNEVDPTAMPALYKFDFVVDTPQDTFINMSQWTKGIVIVNGFVLGRYFMIGPQQTLYLPAPFQQQGNNEVIIFEHFNPAEELLFSENAIYYTAPVPTEI